MKRNRRLLSLSLALAMGALMMLPAGAEVKEYVTDPSLNSLTVLINPWELTEDGTEWCGWANNVSLDPNDKVTLDGTDNKYFTLHNNAFNSTATVISPALKLEKGQKYTLTCKIKYENLRPDIGKTDGVKKGISIGFIGSSIGTGDNEGKLVLDPNTEGTFLSTDYQGTSAGWEEFKGVLEIPADSTMDYFHLKLRCWIGQGIVSFDDVSLKDYQEGDDTPVTTTTAATTTTTEQAEETTTTTKAATTSKPITTGTTGEDTSVDTDGQTDSGSPALWIILAVIVVVVIGGGVAIYFFVIRKPKGTQK